MKLDKQARTLDLDPRDPDFFNDPYRYYAVIRSECPAFYWNNYNQWCFSSFGDVNALLRDKRFGRQILHVATRAELGLPDPKPHLTHFDAVEAHSLLELEPPAHTRLRTLVNRAFVSRQVEKLRPEIAQMTHDLIDQFASQGHVELIRQFAEPIPVSVIARMLGVPLELTGNLLDWSHRMVRMYEHAPTKATELAADEAAQQFSDCLRKLIAERRQAPKDDLLSHMIATERKGERLSDDELVSTSVLLLNAGHEATVHQTGNAVKAILENGLNPSELFADATSSEATVEESLRYDAPLHMFTRYALQDVQLDKHITIKKGEQIGLMLGAANRDPSQFADPSSFKFNRTDQANVSFGAGIHFCLGAPLARLEMQVSLPILFERLPGMALQGKPCYRDAFHFHGLESLNLNW